NELRVSKSKRSGYKRGKISRYTAKENTTLHEIHSDLPPHPINSPGRPGFDPGVLFAFSRTAPRHLRRPGKRPLPVIPAYRTPLSRLPQIGHAPHLATL